MNGDGRNQSRREIDAAIRQAKALNKEMANNAPALLAVDGICAGLEAVIAGWNDSRLLPVIDALSPAAIDAFNTWRRIQRESADKRAQADADDWKRGC